MNSRSKELIKKHEGLSLIPYKDILGFWTVGRGHLILPKDNIKPNDTISLERADELFNNDFDKVLQDLTSKGFLPIYTQQDDVRKAVLENMMFNLGAAKLAGFKRFLGNMQKGYYKDAAHDMKDSLWHKQVKSRAIELEEMVLTGEWQ